MAEHKVYSEYKNTAVNWLDRIPSEWDFRKVENIATFFTGGTPSTANSSYFDGEETWISIGDLNKEIVTSSKKNLTKLGIDVANIPISPKGSLLFSFKLSVGKVAIAGKDLYTNEAIATFVPSKLLNSKFAFYSFPCTIVKNAKKNIYNADLMNSSMIREAKLPLPPLETQQKIVEFLDAETAHIDAGIANMESLIALLTEKRSALISEVVTRGIPGEHAEFKDSGVEWLGEIPVGWDIIGFKHCFSESNETNGKIPFGRMLSISGYRGVEYKEYSSEILKRSNEELENYKIVRKGQLAMNAMWLNYGGLGVSTIEGHMSPDYKAYEIFGNLTPNYTNYLMRSTNYIIGYTGLLRGVRPNGLRMSKKDLDSLPIINPSIEEQNKISAYLDKELKEIDKILAVAKESVSLFKEKRQTLISNVVTGKIDVT